MIIEGMMQRPNRSILLTVFLLASALAVSAAPNYKMVWSDEFQTDGLPDATKWDYEVGGWGWGNNELQFYKRANPRNAWVENGELKLTVRLEDTTWDDRGTAKTSHFSSTRLVTDGKKSWKYGKFEARMKLPRGRGMWPAFWLIPAANVYGGWPKSGEIDVVENYGALPTIMHGSAHMASNYGATSKTAATLAEYPSDSFHIYSLDWRPDTLAISVDGRQYFQYVNPKVGSASWPFDQEFYILLNVAVQGVFGDTVQTQTSNLPQSLVLDWVRVYQDPAISGGVIDPPGSFSLDLAQSPGGTISASPAQASYTPGQKVLIQAVAEAGFHFVGWTSGLASTKPVDTILMDQNRSLQASFARDAVDSSGELAINGGFDQGWLGWKRWSDPSLSPTFELRDGMACVRPGKIGPMDWYVQLDNESIAVAANTTYTISFLAKASRQRELSLVFCQAKEPFQDLGNAARIQVDAAPARKTVSLSVDRTEGQARLEFDLAGDTAEICLDSLSIKAKDPASVAVPLRRIPSIEVHREGRRLVVDAPLRASWAWRSLAGEILRSGTLPTPGRHSIDGLPSGLGILTVQSGSERRSFRIPAL